MLFGCAKLLTTGGDRRKFCRMEIAFQILEQLPAGLARIAVVIGLAILFFLPEMRRKLTWRLWEDDRYEHAKKLLELRQLEIEVEASKSEHPESKNE